MVNVSAKHYCKATDIFVECEECKKRFHAASCANIGENEILELESGDGSLDCTSCKADCGLFGGAV